MENKIYVNCYEISDQWYGCVGVVSVYTNKEQAIADAKAFNMGQKSAGIYEDECIDTFEVNPGEDVQAGGLLIYNGLDDFRRYKRGA